MRENTPKGTVTTSDVPVCLVQLLPEMSPIMPPRPAVMHAGVIKRQQRQTMSQNGRGHIKSTCHINHQSHTTFSIAAPTRDEPDNTANTSASILARWCNKKPGQENINKKGKYKAYQDVNTHQLRCCTHTPLSLATSIIWIATHWKLTEVACVITCTAVATALNLTGVLSSYNELTIIGVP